MRYVLICLILTACGQPKEKCRSAEEAQLTCKAETVGKWFPASAPEFEMRQCEIIYPNGGCY
jgi:hypothetical protein